MEVVKGRLRAEAARAGGHPEMVRRVQSRLGRRQEARAGGLARAGTRICILSDIPAQRSRATPH